MSTKATDWPTAKAFCIAGPQPPPRHGVSSVNEALAALATEEGFAVTSLNTAPPSLERSVLVKMKRLGRVAKAIKGARRFSITHPNAAVYIALSGGWGLVYEALMAWLVRRSGGRIVVHHHSFRYLDAPFAPMSMLVKAAGPNALHVVLGNLMEEKLRTGYPGVGPVLVASNAMFVEERGELPNALRKVGYMSNLSAEKGMNDILATADLSCRRGLLLQFVIAGPFENPEDRSEFERRVQLLGNAQYLGPVYDAKKDEFFHDIDAFLFPTRYIHEAEPLVILEAMSRGKPVIAYYRGCIPSLLTPGGHVVPRERDFAEAAVTQLEEWLGNSRKLIEASEATRRHFDELKRQSLDSRRKLVAWLGAK